MCVDTAPELARIFEKASNGVSSNDWTHANSFAKEVRNTAHRLEIPADGEGCVTLIEFCISAFDTEKGTSVINEVLFEVFEPLKNCSSASPNANKAFETFIGKVAAKCNPQESLTLFLATLGEASE